MILGLSVETFILLHVIISLAGIATGLVVLWAMIGNRKQSVMTVLFLATTILTSLSGFPIPPLGLDPLRIIGILSLVLLAGALLALYVFHLKGWWRPAYVFAAVTSLYLNVFVLVVQLFQKIDFIHTLAPTQNEPPFAISQGIVLLAFVWYGYLALQGFRPASRAMV